MPELPEVESIKRTLTEKVLGQRITNINILWPAAVISLPGLDFTELVLDREIENIARRGKYLLLDLSRGLTLVIHFRMTGRLIFYEGKQPPAKHTHVVLTLEQGELHYSDLRKFGRIQLVPTVEIKKIPSLAKLGPEPLDEDFTFERLGKRLARRKRSTIKSSLLDQRVLAGLGNIYVDEALFRAGIMPNRKTNSLKISEIIKLHLAICEVLEEGIKARGTTFKDYRDALGNKGSFQNSLMVYGRGGLECKVCGQELKREKIAGRTTVYCPHCQN